MIQTPNDPNGDTTLEYTQFPMQMHKSHVLSMYSNMFC